MITTSELRVGNLIGLKDGSVIELTAEILGSLLLKAPETEAFEPVPVSPGWLEKLGFERYAENHFVLTPNPEISVKFAGSVCEVSMKDVVLLSGPLSLHRFQNLIYELTGSTLKITEERDELGEAIRLVADGILYQYIPSDRKTETFGFELSIEGTPYWVTYRKDLEGYWVFERYSSRQVS